MSKPTRAVARIVCEWHFHLVLGYSFFALLPDFQREHFICIHFHPNKSTDLETGTVYFENENVQHVFDIVELFSISNGATASLFRAM
jgi:hypothetical protein